MPQWRVSPIPNTLIPKGGNTEFPFKKRTLTCSLAQISDLQKMALLLHSGSVAQFLMALFGLGLVFSPTLGAPGE